MDTVNFIKQIEKYPMIYDFRIRCSSRTKMLIWQKIAHQFGLTGMLARSRWRAIKEKYILLKRRADAYPGTHFAQQIEEYKYSEYLTFLNDFIRVHYADQPPPPKNWPTKYVPMSNTKSWDKSHTLILIKQLSLHPLLYDSTHPLYCHNLHRIVAYRKIAKVLKRYKPEITQDMVSKKIQTVRTQYTREKKYLQKVQEKYGKPCQPKLWFYNKLYFLENRHEVENQTPSAGDVSHMFELNNDQVDHPENDTEMVDDAEYSGNQNNNIDENKGGDEFSDMDEWLSSRDNSTKPFEQIEIKPNDHDYADEERIDSFEDIIEEEHFDSDESNNEGNPKRKEIYAKCSGLLEILAKQMHPFGKDGKMSKQCDCAKSQPSTLLGKMIETELAQVSERIYLDAKWKIIRILEEAQRNNFKHGL